MYASKKTGGKREGTKESSGDQNGVVMEIQKYPARTDSRVPVAENRVSEEE